MKVQRGVVSTLDGSSATVAALEEKNYITGALRVPPWLRDEERYPEDIVGIGDRVAYAEFMDGTGIVLGKV